MNQKPKILIVDDRVENLLTLEVLLDSFDVNIVRAMSGEEALAQTLDHDFALVLLDVRMPGMDGYEVAELMRGNRNTRAIPIIFVTAESLGDAHIFQGYEAGAVDYLLKPLQPEIFSSKVGVFIKLFEQREALRVKNLAFDQKLAELEKLQQQLEESNEQLLMLSTTDGLTGLINKRKHEEVFADEWQRASRSKTEISLIILDIDHFKLYNDNFGHQMGDDCLRKIAHALADMEMRQLDTVARIGGEEFAIVLPDTDKVGAAMVAERARYTIESLEIPHAPEAGGKWVTASLGYSSVRPDKGQTSPRSLTEAADNALYTSKKRNRNCVSFQEIKEDNSGASQENATGETS
jgi:diguanylate cyclase (GGDEF)-like protein